MGKTPAHNHANLTRLGVFPSDAKLTIEISCGSGVLPREFKIINPDCNYIGIDIAQDYANIATKYYDTTVVADIENQDDFSSKKSRIETVEFSLMHLNTWQTLGSY